MCEEVTITIPADVLVRELEGEAVLLNLETGQYFGLDPVGARLWALLSEHGRVEPAIAAMLDEFDVSEAQLREDVRALLNELAEHGLVEVHAAPAG